MAFPTMGISQLLALHGRSINIHYKGVNGQYNPATGDVVSEEIPSVTVRGYFYDSQKVSEFETQISEGRRRVFFRPTDINGEVIRKPSEGDILEGHRDKVSVVRVDEIMSGEQVLVYICRVRE